MPVMPEIHLYEYPLSEVPVALAQPVTQLALVPEVTQAIRSVVQAIPVPYKPPTRWIEPLQLATDSSILEGFKWRWTREEGNHMAPAVIVGKGVDVDAVAALVHAWATVWRDAVQNTHLEALSQAENLLHLVTRLWDEGALLDAQPCLLSDIILDEAGALNGAAYTLIPALLLRQLRGRKTSVAGGQSIIWELAVGRDKPFALSQLLRADNQALFAYKVEADLQTLAGSKGEEPVVQLRLKQQRYPDGSVTFFPQNTHSILLQTEPGLWCKISSKDYEHVRREAAVGGMTLLAWDMLPELEALEAHPGRYLEQARIIYLTGMRYEQGGESALHPLQVGMTFEELQDVLDPVVQHLELDTNTGVESDTRLAKLLSTLGRKSEARSVWTLKKLKKIRSADPGEILRERIMVATTGRGLEIVVVTRRSHQKFIRELLPATLEEVFNSELEQVSNDLIQIMPGITCRVVQLTAEEATLFEPLDYKSISEVTKDGRSRRTKLWLPAYRQRYYDLLQLLQTHLPAGEGPVRFALIDKPVPSASHVAKWEDVKGVARAAFAELDHLSQFINPYHPKKDGTEYIPRDVPHRVRQGLLDGLRQLGVVLGEPAELYQLMDLPSVDVISIILFQTRFKDIQYPVFSRLTPDGELTLRFPLLSGNLTEWMPSYQAIPALVRLVWSTVDSLAMPGKYRQRKGTCPPLRLSPGKIIDYIREALNTVRSTILIVPAAKLRNRPIWTQLGNKNLGQQSHELVLGKGISIERDHPAWRHLLGIIRYRGPADEVPEYFPISDRRGTSRDYLDAQGWFTESEQFVRYLGIGTIQSMRSNRETIHHGVHSLLHSKRTRPTGKEVEVGASHRYAHARLIEFVPFFVSPSLGEDGPVALCRLAQLTRMMGWHTTTLSLPWPAHVASTAMEDALDVIAAYDGIN